MEMPLDIINITLMRDLTKNLYKAVESLPNDIKQNIFGHARDDNLKRFLKIQKFLAKAVGLPKGMTTLLHKGNINYEYPFKFMTAQVHLDEIPMNFEIPELGQVGIEELFSYGIIDSISAFSTIKIHFLPEKLQQSIRMFGGKHAFCLDIDSIPCEWIINQPYKMTTSFLPAYHYIIARILTVRRVREHEEGINKRLSRKLDRQWKKSIVVRPPPSLKKLQEEEAAAEAEKSS
ncbi:hypothetical protein Ddye_005695 [Dipteronia dyeriana]|uniref:Uncharacterized protein n=1 Tax=Dipteronia dyeriana TaxID=168575 RepID=A0AAD9XH51_9ROSI|nr:hypothetical protein Ddye_005695 [Dipteronia dyeriana]